MELVKHRISLDIHRQTTQAHLAVKKGDTARQIVVSLVSGGVPYSIAAGCYAVFMAKKPDGNILYNDCAIEGNRIIYTFTEQTASAAGLMACELRLYGSNGKLITSPKIAIIVSGTVYEDSEVESTDEFSALSKLVADVQALQTDFPKALPNPQALTINGTSYDGSEAVDITIKDVFEVALSQEKDGTFVQFPTSDEIDSAYKAGKQIRLRYRGRILPLVRFYGVYGTADWGFVFSAIEDNTRHLVTLSSGGIKTLEDTVALQKNIPEPFYVTVSEEAQGEWMADRSYEELLAAKEAGRELQCLYYPNSVSTGAVPGATALLLPLVMHEADDGFTFGGVSDLGAWSVYIGADMTIWGGFVEFGGSGKTPHIGGNGNWWIGEEDTGVKAAGEDGRSVHSVELDANQSDETQSVYNMFDDGDRTIGSFTVYHGKDGAQGEVGPQGQAGVDGYTPVRGTDYWTDGDKAEMVEEVAAVCVTKNQGSANAGKILVVGADGNLTLADMPEGGDVIGTLDESNNILLTGALADGTYTLKYENEDGTYTEIGTLKVGAAEAEPVNLFVVGGDGFILNGRCSSTGADRTDTNGCIVSNYIEVANGDTVYIKNATVVTADLTSSGYSGMKLTDGSTIGFFPNNTTHLTGYAVENGITQFTVNHTSAAYIRICLEVSFGTATTNEAVESKGIIITVNEPLS